MIARDRVIGVIGKNSPQRIAIALHWSHTILQKPLSRYKRTVDLFYDYYGSVISDFLCVPSRPLR